MIRPINFLSGAARLGAVGIAAATGLATPQAQAFPVPGPTLLCCSGNLLFDGSNVVGNVGVADSGEFIGSTTAGPGTITGAVLFSAANTGQFMPDGITVTGGAAFGVTSVQTDINAVNALSQTLSGEAGTTLNISAGGSVNASSGMLDSNGNEVFTAHINPNFVQGTTFTISGTNGQFVVINIPATGSLSFDGSIVLTGGITSDAVLFNFDAGNFETNTGGASVTIANSVPPGIDPLTMGTYLNPNGSFDIFDSVIEGRVFGGPISVTGSDIVAPAAPAPEPTSLALLGTGVAAFGIMRRRRRALPSWS
jgi:hypothetical protein